VTGGKFVALWVNNVAANLVSCVRCWLCSPALDNYWVTEFVSLVSLGKVSFNEGEGCLCFSSHPLSLGSALSLGDVTLLLN